MNPPASPAPLPIPAMRITYLTAGAAGMICGSCLHDNTLAAALLRQGVDIQLIPLYTPIRTDETDVSVDRVFFGGINVYLQQKIPLFRHLPRLLDRWFDSRWLLKLATSRGIETSAAELGGLTVSMLRGSHGYQRKEVGRLVDYLARDVRPQLIVLSNLLISGSVPDLKKRLGVPVLATLQGDDIFLDGLVEPFRARAVAELRSLGQQIDGFLVASNYYADYMAQYLNLPREKMHIIPLGIDASDFGDATTKRNGPTGRNAPAIGYLARLAPEKGLHLLVDAFLKLRARPELANARLEIAGWLGKPQAKYAEEQFARLKSEAGEDAFVYWGTIDRQQKREFLRRLDLFSVPTTYRDPKGLFVLEAQAAGVPVVQPDHGAFPEMLAASSGGRLFRPGDADHLAEVLAELLLDDAARHQLGQAGRRYVLEQANAERMAAATWRVMEKFIDGTYGCP